MSNKRANLEVIAPTVEEAIQKGLMDLGLSQDQVEIEVLDEGSQGLLGIGARQARVRISIISKDTETEASVEIEAESSVEVETEADAQSAVEEEEEVDEEYILNLAKEIVTDLLEKMKLDAQVTAKFGEASEKLRYRPIQIDITGDDLNILVGHQAKTLNDLQLITRLIMGKELKHGVPLSLDVEGYRGRREQQIRELARNAAEQVVNSQRRQALEPMPPNERRFAHIELEDNPNVYTESVGDNPYRKVVIYPEK